MVAEADSPAKALSPIAHTTMVGLVCVSPSADDNYFALPVPKIVPAERNLANRSQIRRELLVVSREDGR